MATLKEWILRLADGEEVEAVIIGEMGWDNFNEPDGVDYKSVIGNVLTWEKAQPYVNYNFDDGYGSPGCNAIAAYTKTKVISVCQYDGATWPFLIARNPVEGFIPGMPGG